MKIKKERNLLVHPYYDNNNNNNNNCNDEDLLIEEDWSNHLEKFPTAADDYCYYYCYVLFYFFSAVVFELWYECMSAIRLAIYPPSLSLIQSHKVWPDSHVSPQKAPAFDLRTSKFWGSDGGKGRG